MATVAPPRPTISPPRRVPPVPGSASPQSRLQLGTTHKSRFPILFTGLVIVAGVLLIAVSLWPQVVQSPSDMGSVMTAQTLPSGTTVLALRQASGQVTTVSLGSGSRLLSADGALIAASDTLAALVTRTLVSGLRGT